MNEPTQISESAAAALLEAVRDHVSVPRPARDLTAQTECDRLLAHRAADIEFVLKDVVLAAAETGEAAAARAVRLLRTWAKRHPVTYVTAADEAHAARLLEQRHQLDPQDAAYRHLAVAAGVEVAA